MSEHAWFARSISEAVQAVVARKSQRAHAHVEGLETRQLLSVSTEEYATIRDTYTAFGLPAEMGQVNVLEIGAADLGVAQLKSAIAEAAATTAADLIVLRTTGTQNRIAYASAVDELTISVGAGQGSVAIVSLGAEPLTIDAGRFARVVSAESADGSGVVNLGGLVMTGGDNVGQGGGVYGRNVALRLQQVTVSGNAAGDLGGGIYQYGGSLTLEDVVVQGNTEDGAYYGTGGGGIYVENAAASLARVRIGGNSASQGGGMYQVGGSVTMADTVIEGNTASGYSVNAGRGGGGFLQQGGTLTMQRVEIRDNGIDGIWGKGGGVRLASGSSTLTDVTIAQNRAKSSGGGLTVFAGEVTLRNAVVAGNMSEEGVGGGIYHEPAPGTLSLVNTTVVQNAANVAGGVYLGNAQLYNTLVARNTAGQARDLEVYEFGVVTGANNLIGDGTGQSALADGVDGNRVGSSSSPIDPRIVEDGGPNTLGMLVVDSPAMDAGSDAWVPGDLLTDRYGNGRVQGERVNIGAVETTMAAKAGVTYVVTGLGDGIASDGVVTLREALEAASGNVAAGDAPAGSYSDRDVIMFAPWVAGTIQPVGTGFAVRGTAAIWGSDAIAIEGFSPLNGRVSLLRVEQGSRVEIVGMTIRKGDADYGGAISALGSELTLSDVRLSGNRGGYGGAVYARNGLTVLRGAVLEGNSASDGGGIYLDGGQVTMDRSILRGNSTMGRGGGMIQVYGQAMLRNTIIADNDAGSGGGIYLIDSELDAVNVTISRNLAQSGGGMAMEQSAGETGLVRLHNTIIGGNVKGDIYGAKSGVVVGTYNLIGTGAIGLVNGVDGNLIGSTIDPMLAEGTTEGIGLTPLAGSAVIDAGDDAWAAGDALDVYGQARVQGARVNIGAVEGVLSPKPGVVFVVSSLADEVKVDGLVTLREAVDAATGNVAVGDAPAGSWSAADRIEFAPGLAGTIRLGGSALEVRSNLQIIGPGADLVKIDAGGKSGVFVLHGPYDVTIQGLSITGGYAGMGGGINSTGTRLTLAYSHVLQNGTLNFGGGIYQQGGTTLLRNVILARNMAGESATNGGGGGMYMYYGTSTVINSLITENVAYAGGGVMCLYGQMQMTNVTVSRNTAQNGGGISLPWDQVTLDNSVVAENSGGDLAGDGSGTYGTFSGTYNLIGVNLVTYGRTLTNGSSGNIVGRAATPVAGMLAEGLGVGSGQAPLAGSPAVDSADASLLPADVLTDVYGNPRVQGGGVNRGAVETVVSPVAGAQYVVTSLADSVAADGVVTLREAIDAATSNAAAGDAPAGSWSEKDVITFAEGLSGKILLEGGELVVAGSVELVGPGSRWLSVDGQGQSRVMGSYGRYDVSLRGLTFEGGSARSGAGLRVAGSQVQMQDMVFSGNAATHYGGGIQQLGGATSATATIVRGNTALIGAGVALTFGPLSLVNVLIYDNNARAAGGIYGAGGPITLTNVTISRNAGTLASGGMYVFGGSSVTMSNTIVAGNPGGDATIETGVQRTGRNNLIGDSPVLSNGVNGNIVGTAANPVDAMLADGVEARPALTPLTGSPAIDAGDDALVPAGVVTDVYGHARIQGLHVNMGAVEGAADAVAPAVTVFAINDGAAQRSVVRKVTVVFSEAVVIGPEAISVVRSDGQAVAGMTVSVVNSSGDQRTYELSFSGTAVIGGSLPDGIYDLLVSAAGVQDLAGNVLTANYTQRFHRLFGDSDGNRVVNALDYVRLRNTLGRASSDPLFNSAFDYEANNLINALDLARFRQRYGMSFSY